MKVFSILIFVFTSCLSVSGQYASPELISTAGSYFAASNVSISWSACEIMPETFQGSTSILSQGFQQTSRRLVVSGKLSYQNTLNSPLSNVKVYLKNMNGMVMDSAISSSNGNFRFYNTQAGSYIFSLMINKPWGGVNATDALLASKHFISVIELTGLYRIAADVNNTHNINSLDALIISKRFTGIIPSFPVDDWIYTADTIIVGASPLVHNLRAICAGDANGSYIPALKLSKSIEFVHDSDDILQAAKDIILPLKATERITLGAISLVVDLGSADVDVKQVDMPLNNGTLHYHVAGNMLRISWYATQAITIEKDAVVLLISLTSKAENDTGNPAIAFSCTDESEIADAEAEKYTNVKWSVPAIQFGQKTNIQSFVDIIPNPFSVNTQFVYYLQEKASLTFTIFNVIGDVVRQISIENQAPGTNIYNFNGELLSKGVYVVRIEMKSQSETKYELKRIIVTH